MLMKKKIKKFNTSYRQILRFKNVYKSHKIKNVFFRSNINVQGTENQIHN